MLGADTDNAVPCAPALRPHSPSPPLFLRSLNFLTSRDRRPLDPLSLPACVHSHTLRDHRARGRGAERALVAAVPVPQRPACRGSPPSTPRPLNGERGAAGVPPGPARSGRRPGAGTRRVSPPLRPHTPRPRQGHRPGGRDAASSAVPRAVPATPGADIRARTGTRARYLRPGAGRRYPVRLASGDLPAEQPPVEVRERMRIRAVQDHRRKRKPRFPGHDRSVHSTRCRRVVCPSAGPPLSVVPRTVAPVTIRAAGASRTRPAPVTARGGGAHLRDAAEGAALSS